MVGGGCRVQLFDQPQRASPLLEELTQALDIVRARKGSAALPTRDDDVIGRADALNNHPLSPAALQACAAQQLIGVAGAAFFAIVLSPSAEYVLLPPCSSYVDPKSIPRGS
jgi:hypothetical protein